MKKILSFVIVVAAVAMVGCGGKTTKAVDNAVDATTTTVQTADSTLNAAATQADSTLNAAAAPVAQ